MSMYLHSGIPSLGYHTILLSYMLSLSTLTYFYECLHWPRPQHDRALPLRAHALPYRRPKA